MDQYFLHVQRENWLISIMYVTPYPQKDNGEQAILWLSTDLWQRINTILKTSRILAHG